MGELFEISYLRFLDEVRHAKLIPNGTNKIEEEDLGEMFAFYLTPVGIDKTYVTVIEKNKITDVQRSTLMAFAKPARRIKDNVLSDISQTLLRMEEDFKKVPMIK